MNCKNCGAPIRFVRMASGKYMPCNADKVWYRPVDGGTQTIVADVGGVLEAGVIVGAEYAEPWEPGAYQGYTPHWINCPGADKFRWKNK